MLKFRLDRYINPSFICNRRLRVTFFTANKPADWYLFFSFVLAAAAFAVLFCSWYLLSHWSNRCSPPHPGKGKIPTPRKALQIKLPTPRAQKIDTYPAFARERMAGRGGVLKFRFDRRICGLDHETRSKKMSSNTERGKLDWKELDRMIYADSKFLIYIRSRTHFCALKVKSPSGKETLNNMYFYTGISRSELNAEFK